MSIDLKELHSERLKRRESVPPSPSPSPSPLPSPVVASVTPPPTIQVIYQYDLKTHQYLPMSVFPSQPDRLELKPLHFTPLPIEQTPDTFSATNRSRLIQSLQASTASLPTTVSVKDAVGSAGTVPPKRLVLKKPTAASRSTIVTMSDAGYENLRQKGAEKEQKRQDGVLKAMEKEHGVVSEEFKSLLPSYAAQDTAPVSDDAMVEESKRKWVEGGKKLQDWDLPMELFSKVRKSKRWSSCPMK